MYFGTVNNLIKCTAVSTFVFPCIYTQCSPLIIALWHKYRRNIMFMLVNFKVVVAIALIQTCFTESTEPKAECHLLSVNNRTCPPWTRNSSQGCMCLKDKAYFDGKLRCDQHTNDLLVIGCHCMTYDSSSGFIQVGACFENCAMIEQSSDPMYHLEFPPNGNMSSFNEVMCQNRFNRAGRLCGKCLQDYSPQAYSFNLTCVNCTEGNRNLWKYFVYSLAPLTVFYFFVLFMKVNTTSSHLHGFVIFALAIAAPQSSRNIQLTLHSEKPFTYAVEFIASLYEIWNLDFFRMFNLGICLDMAPLTVAALDYTIAVYPFFLTVISYILIELYDRNYRVLVWIWKPFRCICNLFRKKWELRTSIIDAYATFFQLSCFKILCISFDLLAPTFVYTVGEPKESAKLVLYFDGTVDFFEREHLPYAVVALVFTFFFVAFPTLLLLIYPFQSFQHLLNRCHFHSHILQTFIDSLNGCYKDGTEPGTRDCRWFAAVDNISRLSLFVVFLLTKDALYCPFAALVILCHIVLILNLRPYKNSVARYTQIDLTFYSLLGLFYLSVCSYYVAALKDHYFTKGLYVLNCIIAFVPLLYMLCLSIHWLYTQRRWGRTFVNRLRAWRRGYDLLEESLPHRILNPELYPEQRLAIVANAR